MVRLPSVQLDLVAEDFLSATRAQVLSSATAPFALEDGMVLELELDGDPLTFTLHDTDFANIAEATLTELLTVLAPAVASVDGDAFESGSSFAIRSRSYGPSSSIEISASTAAAPLGLALATYNGATVAAGETLVANRNPQPSEVQVPLVATINFDFIRIAGSDPDDEFLITVNGTVAYNGDFQNGFTGDVEEEAPDDATWRFHITPPEPFTSGQVVAVHLEVNGDEIFDWSFTAYDLTPPLFASVAAVNKDQVRVTFNEEVTMVSASVEGDALNPSSYFIERVSRPAVTPTVTAVERMSDNVVLLTTSIELTFGAFYMLVVTGITDEFENLFEPPDNTIQFAGFLPPFPAGRRFLLHDFVPTFTLAEDVTDDLRLFLGCLQDTTNLLLHMVDKWGEILDPDEAPEEFLDAMLADLGNPFDFELPTPDVKRKLAKVLVRIYQLKGTVRGIVDVVRFFLGIEIEVDVFNGKGWRLGFDKLSSATQIASPNPAIIGPSGGALYSFRVLTESTLTDLQRTQITTIARYMKGAQEHLVPGRTPL